MRSFPCGVKEQRAKKKQSLTARAYMHGPIFYSIQKLFLSKWRIVVISSQIVKIIFFLLVKFVFSGFLASRFIWHTLFIFVSTGCSKALHTLRVGSIFLFLVNSVLPHLALPYLLLFPLLSLLLDISFLVVLLTLSVTFSVSRQVPSSLSSSFRGLFFPGCGSHYLVSAFFLFLVFLLLQGAIVLLLPYRFLPENVFFLLFITKIFASSRQPHSLTVYCELPIFPICFAISREFWADSTVRFMSTSC